jgi:hypothetical protein
MDFLRIKIIGVTLAVGLAAPAGCLAEVADPAELAKVSLVDAAQIDWNMDAVSIRGRAKCVRKDHMAVLNRIPPC